MSISFFAVYREAFEVVLFYQALWLQNESSRGAVIWGFVTGLAALLVVTFAILKLGVRIPLKYFFGPPALSFILWLLFLPATGSRSFRPPDGFRARRWVFRRKSRSWEYIQRWKPWRRKV